MSDTPLNIEIRMAQMIALRIPSERLRMASGMFDSVRRLMAAGLRRENRLFTEAQVRARIFLRCYGELFTTAEIERIMKSIPNMQLEVKDEPPVNVSNEGCVCTENRSTS